MLGDAESDREVLEAYALISQRNRELASRNESPQIPIPPKHLVDGAVRQGHNAGEIVDQLTEERKDPLAYQCLKQAEESSPRYVSLI